MIPKLKEVCKLGHFFRYFRPKMSAIFLVSKLLVKEFKARLKSGLNYDSS